MKCHALSITAPGGRAGARSISPEAIAATTGNVGVAVGTLHITFCDCVNWPRKEFAQRN